MRFIGRSIPITGLQVGGKFTWIYLRKKSSRRTGSYLSREDGERGEWREGSAVSGRPPQPARDYRPTGRHMVD